MLARLHVPSFTAALFALTIIGGCRSDRPTETEQATSLPALDLSNPESTTRAALNCLREQVRAIADRHRVAEKRWTERLHQIAAIDAIHSLLARTPQLRIVLGNDPVAKYIDLWGATVSYYLDQFDFDAARRAPAARQSATVTVVVPAYGHGRSALIKVDCVRGADDIWRVAYVGLSDPLATAVPTTQSTP